MLWWLHTNPSKSDFDFDFDFDFVKCYDFVAKRIAKIIERLILINPFFHDLTDRINHTENRPYMYMHQ